MLFLSMLLLGFGFIFGNEAISWLFQRRSLQFFAGTLLIVAAGFVAYFRSGGDDGFALVVVFYLTCGFVVGFGFNVLRSHNRRLADHVIAPFIAPVIDEPGTHVDKRV